jgi:hypothetical protein
MDGTAFYTLRASFDDSGFELQNCNSGCRIIPIRPKPGVTYFSNNFCLERAKFREIYFLQES